MFNELKKKKIRDWCFFDFGISAYPTLILTFFYGAFYAKKIALTPEIGTSNWGFAISLGSAISFLVFLSVLLKGNTYLIERSETLVDGYSYLDRIELIGVKGRFNADCFELATGCIRQSQPNKEQ